MNASLRPLDSFILPGGTAAAAYLHLARTITRRAERLVSELAAGEPVNPEALKYLNRPSDHRFVLGRRVNDDGHRANLRDRRHAGSGYIVRELSFSPKETRIHKWDQEFESAFLQQPVCLSGERRGCTRKAPHFGGILRVAGDLRRDVQAANRDSFPLFL
jgi:hypothetical protein